MKIFVISLPEATARRAAIARQMAALGLTYSLIDGVRPDSTRLAELGYNERGRLLRYGYGMSPGEIGCFLAHRQAWRAVQSYGKKSLVLEDDVLVPGLNAALLEQLELAPYPIVRLAGVFEKRHKFVGDGPFAKYWGDPAGTAGYVLGPREAAQLLRRSARFYMAVDDFMEARHLHGINTYALLPYPVRQAGTDTQIGHRLRPHLSGFARLRLMLVRIPIDLHKYFRRVIYYVL
ncbi:MAG: glycosyltransferase family 25 protein [Polaromonas sp.]